MIEPAVGIDNLSDTTDPAGAQLASSLRYAVGALVVIGVLLGLAAAVLPWTNASVAAGAVAVLCSAAAVEVLRRRLARKHPNRTHAAILVIIVAAITLHASIIGLGVHSALMGGYAVVVVVAGQIFGWRGAVLSAGACFSLVLLLASAESAGWIAGLSRRADSSIGQRVLGQAVLLGLAVIAGWSLGALLKSALERAQAQERRFRTLLGLAADWYWEQDAESRFTRVAAVGAPDLPLEVTDVLGRRRWEVNQFMPDVGNWAAHQADIDAHRPFHALRTTQHTSSGAVVHMSVSGEPVFDPSGRFQGYWGVSRNVTTEEQARLRLEAMFAHAMVGIAFTQDQQIKQVNEHFARLMGGTVDAMVGQPGSVVWINLQDHIEVGRTYGPALARGEGVDFERRLRRGDGSTFLAHIRASAIDPRRPAEGGTIWVVEDITERRQADQALAAAKAAAEAASQAKSAFLANTSHEIRTPLNGVIGLVRLALEPGVTPDKQREYLEHIDDSARTLAALISDTLDLSKIEAGKLTLEATDFELPALLRSVHAMHHSQALDKGLACELVLDPGLPGRVHGDPTRLRQILTNLLANAVKFTEQGAISLRAGPDPAHPGIRLEVQDTGIGIDQATLARLFTPFTQADQSTTRRFGGTGLGLSICRELAHLMGGEIEVHSEPGRGSRFVVHLPLPEAHAAHTVEPTAAQAGQPAAQVADRLQGMRVLLVEDNAVNLLITTTMLRNWGVDLITAGDGQQAVEAALAHGHTLDLVLMDVHMPVMSGHDATARIRAHYSMEELPIVALTAAALVSERKHSQALGMNDFITKPFEAEQLRQALLRWGRRAPGPSAELPASP